MKLFPLVIIALAGSAFAADPPKETKASTPPSATNEPAAGISRKAEVNNEGRILEYAFTLSGERLLITRHQPRTWDGKGSEAEWRAADTERVSKEPSLRVDMKNIQKVGAFFVQFIDMEARTRERDVAPFTKVLGKIGEGAASEEFTFHWSAAANGQKSARLTPGNFEGDDVAHVLALLRAELPDAKKERDQVGGGQVKPAEPAK